MDGNDFMVKYKPLKENIFREYFSYLVDPILSLSRLTESKFGHRYRARKPSNVASYFNGVVSESKIRQLYRGLDYLNDSSRKDLEQQKKQGLIPGSIHPIDEQNWFIEYLRPRIETFSAEDAWIIMLNDGQRDKYTRFLLRGSCVSQFEIFIQNYFFSALPASKLVEIFFIAYENEEEEREEQLRKYLESLSFRQTTLLIETLKKITIDEKCWLTYCRNLLKVMRNAQIKDVIFILPMALEDEALKKLYPYEVVEVVEVLQKGEKKEALIRKILENAIQWWDGFSHDETKEALAILRSQ